MLNLEIQRAIEAHYQFLIQSCEVGPCQFVASTFVIRGTAGQSYFCKVIQKPLFIPQILKALPVMAQMHDRGMMRICYPILGVSGLSLLVGEQLVVLYNYIPVPQGFGFDFQALGQLLAEIHAITPQVTVEIPVEDCRFESSLHQLFDRRFEEALHSKSPDAVEQALKKLLQLHEVEIRGHRDHIRVLGEYCRNSQGCAVITHGDVRTNILVKAPDDLYIIDWDELRLAPPERDLWMLDDLSGCVEAYQKKKTRFEVDRKRCYFFTLQYYFERMLYKITEITNPLLSEPVRLQHLDKLSQGRMAGWFVAKIDEILLKK